MKKIFKNSLVLILIIISFLGFNVYRNNKEVTKFLDLVEIIDETYTAEISVDGEEVKTFLLTEGEMLELKDILLKGEYEANFNNNVLAGDTSYDISFLSPKEEKLAIEFYIINEYYIGTIVFGEIDIDITWMEMQSEEVMMFIDSVIE